MTLPSRITTEPIGTSPCAAAAAASSNASCIATSSSTGRNGNGDGRQPEEPEEAAGRRKGAGVGRQGDEFNTERSGGAGAVRAKHSGDRKVRKVAITDATAAAPCARGSVRGLRRRPRQARRSGE